MDRVAAACRAIAAQDGARLSLADLARIVRIGPHQLLRSFKQALGITPRQFADACRSGCLKRALRTANGVADATYAAGFGSGSRVYERAASTLGMTPARYAAGAKGERVTYAIAGSSLGHVLVARTPRGICSVAIGDDANALSAAVGREFPGASIVRGDRELRTAIRQIIASLEGTAPDPRLPLDVRATAFQQRVWQELQRIPRGATHTYLEVARAIGRPTAARAVARACAANPTAIIVPCHRVVCGDGAPGGYRWGSARKVAMLAAEKRRD